MPKNKQEEKVDFSSHDMRIHVVKPTIKPIPLKRPLNPILPKPATSWFWVCSSGSGKTNMCTNLVLRPEFYGGIFDKILIISPTVENDNSTQPYFHESMEDVVTIRSDAQNMDSIIEEYVNYIKDNFDPKDADKPDPPVSLIIADDVSGFLKNSNVVTDLITRNRHNWISLFVSNQTLKTVPRNIRTLSKNIVLSRTTNEMEKMLIAQEYGGNFKGGIRQMLEVWDHATRERYNFLWINGQDENNVRIMQIGSMGIHEYEGVSRDSAGEYDAPHIPTEEIVAEPQEKSISLQLKEMGDEFTCDTCDKSFKTQRSLMSHQGSRAHKKKAGQLLR